MIAPAIQADESIGTVKSNSWEVKSCQLDGVEIPFGQVVVSVVAEQEADTRAAGLPRVKDPHSHRGSTQAKRA